MPGARSTRAQLDGPMNDQLRRGAMWDELKEQYGRHRATLRKQLREDRASVATATLRAARILDQRQRRQDDHDQLETENTRHTSQPGDVFGLSELLRDLDVQDSEQLARHGA